MKLLEHFKELSLHPKNAEELKGLIIRLALRGKLTEKWREDNSVNENATDLLAKIKEEKASLILKRKLKLRKVEEIQATKDMMYNIPETWCWYNFSDVVFFQEGPGIRKWQFRDEGVKLLNVQNIVGDELVLENTNKHVQLDEFEQKYRHFKVEEGDLLFASSGGSWGKSAWFIDPGYDVMLNTSMIRMCFYGKKWYPSYLKTFVSSGIFIDQMTEQLVGMQPNFGSTHLSRIYIPIPPLEEQKALVEVVNTLFAEVEQLESLTKERIQLKESFVVSALNKLIEAENTQQEWNFLQQHFSSFFTEKKNIKSLRETILQLAVQGKLTETWRKKEDLQNYKWIKTILGEQINLIMGQAPPGSECNKDGRGTPFVKVGQFSQFRPEINEWTTKPLKLVTTKHVLICVVGATIGKINLGIDCAIGRSVAGLLPKDGVLDQMYLYFFLSTWVEKFRSKARGSAQGVINKTQLNSVELLLPSIEEQKVIVEKVNALMALCDELEQQIESSNIQIEQLMQSCLKEVFDYESN